ncbi:FAD:protein FMN transferase [Azospirillum sp. ST 5-10]|uniref:FAD:protein FMN transferase n=1 Tax=unclassified Azospirillum TaxID=2630922 RepID=UPI003F49DF42
MSAPVSRSPLGRRRFIAIGAAAAGLALLPGAAPAAAGGERHVWRGTALGAAASLTLYHPDRGEAERLIRLCLAEVARLERAFSLYRPDSELARLNRDGALDAPSTDFVRLMGEAAGFAAATGGAFDPTVQPLWQLHAAHPEPPPALVEAARRLVDHRALRVEAGRVAFARRGMAATLNGIAQGYVTDRVAELLRAEGMDRVLVDLGEIRALGRRPDGRPWTIGLEDPDDPARLAATLEIADRAVATSGDYGVAFGHLFDPATGRPARLWRSVTVQAAEATTADALSTALAVVPAGRAAAILRGRPGVTARLTAPDGAVLALASDGRGAG